MHKGMTIVLANLVLAHIAAGGPWWSSPDEYLSTSLAAMLFHFGACRPPVVRLAIIPRQATRRVPGVIPDFA